jgi:hypothetical protein
MKIVRNFVDKCCVSRFFEAQLGFPRDACSLGSELEQSNGGATEAEVEEDKRECQLRSGLPQQNPVTKLT